MKQLLSDPLVLTLLVSIGLVYLVISFQLISKNSQWAKTVEKIFIVSSMLIISGMTIRITHHLHPSTLYRPELQTKHFVMNIGFYLPFLILIFSRLYHRTKAFFDSLPTLFGQAKFLGLYLILQFVISLTSETPIHTLKASLVLISVTLAFMYVGKEYTMKELFILLVWYHGVNAVLSLFFGTNKADWTGIYVHKNYFGGTMALASVVLYIQSVRVPKYRTFFLGLAALAVFLVQQSGGGMAKVILIILIALLIFLRFIRQLPPRLAFASMALFLALSISLVILISTNAEYIIVEKLGKDMTLTGRTYIWESLTEVNKRPWFGYGYDGFWQPWRGSDNPAFSVRNQHNRIPGHGHNGFWEIRLQVGWIGLAVFMHSFIVTVYYGILHLTRNKEPESALPLLILAWIIIIAVTEVYVSRITTHWVFYVLMTTRLALNQGRYSSVNNQVQKFNL